MQIKLLGTGSAEGWPGLFCECRVCEQSRLTGGKDIRSRSSAIVDGALKIDLPPDTFYQSIQFGLRMAAVTAIVFTHSHDDHLAQSELQYLSWMFVPQPRTTRLPVAGSVSVIEKIRDGIDLDKVLIDLIVLEPWVTVSIGDYKITPIMANHDPMKICFNLIIEKDDSRLLYATDTGWYSEATWTYLAGVKLDGVVVEASRAEHETFSEHLSLGEVIAFRKKLIELESLSADAPFVTTHHSHRSGLLHNEIEAVVHPENIAVGFDGMEFTI